MKKIRKKYTDGYLVYGTMKTKRSATKKRIGEKFEGIGTFAFRELSKREQDYQLSEIQSASLDVKVATPFPIHFKKHAKANLKVVIDSTTFDVIRVDTSEQLQEIYWYLQEVGDFIE